jgi:hypothetical protein
VQNRTPLLNLIDADLRLAPDPSARDEMKALILEEPCLMSCAWDYGAPGETYPCWKVAGSTATGRVGVVYCEHGFGPEFPWGLIWLNQPVPDMGQDSGWFRTLREALADAFDRPEWVA